MIKIKIAKFILVFVLALVSINACYPSDFECADNSEVASVIKKEIAITQQAPTQESSQSKSSDSDTHYCLCTLTCHTMFMSFSPLNDFTSYVLSFPKEFQYISQFYPEISYSLEKPPTV